MGPKELIEEYGKSIAVYQKRIKEIRAQPPPLSGTERNKLATMEAALMDMQYAVGVLKRDVSMGVITPRRWV